MDWFDEKIMPNFKVGIISIPAEARGGGGGGVESASKRNEYQE
jgi:hypothetical protein